MKKFLRKIKNSVVPEAVIAKLCNALGIKWVAISVNRMEGAGGLLAAGKEFIFSVFDYSEVENTLNSIKEVI